MFKTIFEKKSEKKIYLPKTEQWNINSKGRGKNNLYKLHDMHIKIIYLNRRL